MLHGHDNIEMDATRGYMTNSLKYIRVYDTRVAHVSGMTRLHDRSVRAT